jgi:hypothetical protein
MKTQNQFTYKNFFTLFMASILMISSGCSSKNTSYEAFSSSESVNNNAKTISASVDNVWSSSMELVAQQGFNIEQINAKDRILSISKDFRNKDDQELSHTVKATITIIPLSDQQIRVMLSANQITELHKQSYTWWHLLWMIPIIPTGTEYTTVVTDRDTINDPDFYNDFFSGLLAKVAVKNKEVATVKANQEKIIADNIAAEKEKALAAAFSSATETNTSDKQEVITQPKTTKKSRRRKY